MFELAAVQEYPRYAQTRTSEIKPWLIYVSLCQILHYNQMLYYKHRHNTLIHNFETTELYWLTRTR